MRPGGKPSGKPSGKPGGKPGGKPAKPGKPGELFPGYDDVDYNPAQYDEYEKDEDDVNKVLGAIPGVNLPGGQVPNIPGLNPGQLPSTIPGVQTSQQTNLPSSGQTVVPQGPTITVAPRIVSGSWR